MIAVVTGTGGFVGSHLVDALLASGATVRAIARPQSAPGVHDSRVEKHVVDLLDARATAASPVWNGATHVFHIGGVTKARTLAQFRLGNVTPTANLFARRHWHAGRSAACHPDFVPGRRGAGIERGAPSDRRRFSTAHRGIRPFKTRSRIDRRGIREPGTRRHRTSSLRLWPARPRFSPRVSLGNESHRIPRRTKHPRVLDSPCQRPDRRTPGRGNEPPCAIGKTFFLFNPAATTWRELYDTFAQVSGARPVQLLLPQPFLATVAFGNDLLCAVTGRTSLLNRNKFALSQPRWWICSADRARIELDWQPRMELHTGLRDTYLWYVRAGWLRAATQPTPAQSPEDPNA